MFSNSKVQIFQKILIFFLFTLCWQAFGQSLEALCNQGNKTACDFLMKERLDERTEPRDIASDRLRCSRDCSSSYIKSYKICGFFMSFEGPNDAEKKLKRSGAVAKLDACIKTLISRA